jgi:hypothetical protein
VLFPERTAAQRAQETHTHPETVGTLKRRFEPQGLLGLLPDHVAIVTPGRQGRVPDAVVLELERLKGLSSGFEYRALCRIISATTGYRLSDKTIKKLWEQLPPGVPQQLPLLDYHSYSAPSQARLQVIQLYVQGWSKTSIRRLLHVSRPTITEWIGRFERANLAALADQRSAPKTPSRKAWLPVLMEVYQLPKRHPDAGGFRLWRLRGKSDIAVRTVERIMALNRHIYDDIPHKRTPAPKPPPPPHPYKATRPHEDWCIDGRRMDCALDGVRWWSLIL